MKRLISLLLIVSSIAVLNCSNKQNAVLFRDSVNINTELRQRVSNIHFKPSESYDSDGSYMINTDSSSVIPLLTVSNIDIDNAVILYSAMVKTEKLRDRCYLEMWCFFPGGGRYFSRGLDNALTGNNDWTKMSTPFFLKEGENPDSIHLNIVTQGSGTVYIDNIILRCTDN